jgi:hypothetical protein
VVHILHHLRQGKDGEGKLGAEIWRNDQEKDTSSDNRGSNLEHSHLKVLPDCGYHPTVGVFPDNFTARGKWFLSGFGMPGGGGTCCLIAGVLPGWPANRAGIAVGVDECDAVKPPKETIRLS